MGNDGEVLEAVVTGARRISAPAANTSRTTTSLSFAMPLQPRNLTLTLSACGTLCSP